MPFRGPSRGFDPRQLPEQVDYDQRQAEQETLFDQSLRAYSASAAASRGMRDSVDRDAEASAARDEGMQRLAMTPGVSSGASRRPYTISDSPELAPRSFQRFGQSYQFDPGAAAATTGAMAGEQQNAEERARLSGLTRIPGITPRMASRMVMGRTGVLDEGDPSELRSTLAEYLRNPSREAAARAVGAGANINQFPDRFLAIERDAGGNELPRGGDVPRRGTPEYLKMLQDEGNVEVGLLEREAPIRAEATAATRAPVRDRVVKMIGPNGEIGRQNLDTGEVDWSGEVGARPGGKSSMLDQMLSQPGGAPVAPPAGPAPAGPRVPAGAPAGTTGTRVPGEDPAERDAFMVAYSRLRRQGVKNITPAMVRAEMARGRP